MFQNYTPQGIEAGGSPVRSRAAGRGVMRIASEIPKRERTPALGAETAAQGIFPRRYIQFDKISKGLSSESARKAPKSLNYYLCPKCS